MAWSSTIIGRTKAGNKRIHFGTWDGTGVTGGDINTGLVVCEACVISHIGAAVEVSTATLNETFPMASGSPTVVCTAGDSGTWMAIGY